MISAAGTATTSKTKTIVIKTGSLVDAIESVFGAIHGSLPDSGNFRTERGGNCRRWKMPSGDWFFCQQGGIEEQYIWQEDTGTKTPEQIAYAKKLSYEREIDEEAKTLEEQAAAATKAQNDLSTLLPAKTDDPYPTRKGITPYGAYRDVYGSTFAPVYDFDSGEIINKQEVSATPKYVVTGGRLKDCWLPMGIDPTVHPRDIYSEDGWKTETTVPLQPETVLYVVEGWASGCSLLAGVQSPVFVAFGCKNIVDVVKQLRLLYKPNRIVICADTGHAGFTDAMKASNAVDNCRFITPEFSLGGAI